jgi:hypothetical protein
MALSRDVLFKPEVVCSLRNIITKTESTCPILHIARSQEIQIFQNRKSDDENDVSTSGGSSSSNPERHVQDRKSVREK